MQRWIARALVAVLGVAGGMSAFAANPTPQEGVETVRAQKRVAYEHVLAEYDQRIAAAPDDAVMQVARCSFISNFTYEEDEDYVLGAADAWAQCRDALASRWPKSPEVQLFLLEDLYGSQAIERGESLLAAAKTWPLAMRRALLAKLASANDDQDHDDRAGELALDAVRLGDTSVVSIAVDHLRRKGKTDEATAMLRNAAAPESDGQKYARIDAALALPDKQAAAREIRRWVSPDFAPSPAQAARAYLRAGDLVAARKAAEGLSSRDYGDANDRLRFDVALAAGDYAQAVSMLEVSKLGTFGETFRRFAALLKASPATLFRPSMLLVAALVALMFVPLLLLPGLVLLPVHYRGLVRRVEGRAATPLFASLGLGHAWYAGAVLIAFSFVGAFAAAGPGGTLLVDGQLDSSAVFRMAAWGTGFGLLCMAFVGRRLWRRSLVGDGAMWRATWWRILAAWAVLLVIGLLIGAINHAVGFDADTDQTRMVRALAGAGHTAGQWAVLLVVALVAPIFEELVFRGALLGGLSRHISFGWANAWQAALFAAIHGDPPRLPYYFAMGLFGGWLVRRTGSLAPAIALHMLNNAVAMGLMLAFVQ